METASQTFAQEAFWPNKETTTFKPSLALRGSAAEAGEDVWVVKSEPEAVSRTAKAKIDLPCAAPHDTVYGDRRVNPLRIGGG